MVDLLALTEQGQGSLLTAALAPLLTSPHVFKAGCGLASDFKRLARHHPDTFTLAHSCLDLSTLWRLRHIEQSECGMEVGTPRLPQLSGAGPATMAFAPQAARSPPPCCPCLAAGKRSTAGYKRRAGEVSLSQLAQSVLGKVRCSAARGLSSTACMHAYGTALLHLIRRSPHQPALISTSTLLATASRPPHHIHEAPGQGLPVQQLGPAPPQPGTAAVRRSGRPVGCAHIPRHGPAAPPIPDAQWPAAAHVHI